MQVRILIPLASAIAYGVGDLYEAVDEAEAMRLIDAGIAELVEPKKRRAAVETAAASAVGIETATA